MLKSDIEKFLECVKMVAIVKDIQNNTLKCHHIYISAIWMIENDIEDFKDKLKNEYKGNWDNFAEDYVRIIAKHHA